MENIKVLVVDDESRMRKLVKDFLTREGYAVLEAGDGMEAMDIFYEDKEIALVILDVMMPKMDGWQVCREIRETSKVPIIMLTARSEERDEFQGFELGVDEYVTKPFSPKILVARVEAILRRSNVNTDDGIIRIGDITMNIFSQIGIIMLIGLVAKNGILIVEFANQKQEAGEDKMSAIKDAALQRLRPILMTSASTVLGLIPLAFATGEGCNQRIAMGTAVVGGMLVSTFLTMYIVPAIYSYISTNRSKLKKS